jgi:hypothetical protein
VTRNERNEAVAAATPGGLAGVPNDHWFRVARGEVLVGQFSDQRGRDVLAFACHNPYESQDVKLAFAAEPKGVEYFDRAARKWVPLKPDGKAVAFKAEDYGVELVRVSR